MEWQKRLSAALPDYLNDALLKCPDEWLMETEEIRVRTGGATLCRAGGARKLCDVPPDGVTLLVESLTRGNMHALGECVRRGFVPLPGGFRAGICGRALVSDGDVTGMEDISGVCIRVSREIIGAAGGVIGHILDGRRARSALILSAPGLGKTTLLRDIARRLSLAGLNVALADERGELAGAGQDVGPNTDVMSFCPKALCMNMLVRAMRPDVIVTDELGASGDARAVADAIRCGAAVIASAHGASLAQAAARPELGEGIRAGLYERIMLIEGPRPGSNIKIFDGKGNSLC